MAKSKAKAPSRPKKWEKELIHPENRDLLVGMLLASIVAMNAWDVRLMLSKFPLYLQAVKQGDRPILDAILGKDGTSFHDRKEAYKQWLIDIANWERAHEFAKDKEKVKLVEAKYTSYYDCQKLLGVYGPLSPEQLQKCLGFANAAKAVTFTAEEINYIRWGKEAKPPLPDNVKDFVQYLRPPTPQETYAMAAVAFIIVIKPELLTGTVKGIGEILKGIGEMIPL